MVYNSKLEKGETRSLKRVGRAAPKSQVSCYGSLLLDSAPTLQNDNTVLQQWAADAADGRADVTEALAIAVKTW
ncbi:hypothetical protein AGMMS49983_17550 [Clostridia bacterium]|nr:hypothetical protein AGMMS49983_17550 [Clostridia bacterium]